MKPTATAEKPFKVAFLVRQKNGAIWEAMKKRGWNQTETAEFLGWSPKMFGKIINFKTRLPEYVRTPHKRKALEEKLMELTGKTVDELFPDEVYNDEVLAQAKPLELIVERDISQLSLTGEASLMLKDGRLSLEQREIIEIAKSVLSLRELEVIERVASGETYTSIGQTSPRPVRYQTISQISNRARLKMRGALRRLGIKKISECVA